MPRLTYRQVVEERNRYFHPFGWGRGWPKEPPNYLGFRYDGQLQSIHHVESAEVMSNFHSIFPEAPNEDSEPLLVYRLGPPIKPPSVVKTGNLFRSVRMWAIIDLLLTSKTIAQACDKSKARKRKAV